MLADDLVGELVVMYAFGPPYGERLITRTDLNELDMGWRALRRQAAQNLSGMGDQVRVHGQPPSLMLSFDGLESSLLLVDELWERLARQVPGELVIGVPARDVVIVTGSESEAGLEKARRAVDRVFYAGDEHLLSPDLLVRRRGAWAVL